MNIFSGLFFWRFSEFHFLDLFSGLFFKVRILAELTKISLVGRLNQGFLVTSGKKTGEKKFPKIPRLTDLEFTLILTFLNTFSGLFFWRFLIFWIIWIYWIILWIISWIYFLDLFFGFEIFWAQNPFYYLLTTITNYHYII